MKVIAIDPGQKGAFFFLDSDTWEFEYGIMPLTVDKRVDFDAVCGLLGAGCYPEAPVYLERAAPFKMGVSGAFNYGRDFAALEIAIRISKRAVTYVEPRKWTKVMHEGTDANLKPKIRSVIAMERLFPQLLPRLPKSTHGKYDEGMVDALLIAGFAIRVSS